MSLNCDNPRYICMDCNYVKTCNSYNQLKLIRKLHNRTCSFEGRTERPEDNNTKHLHDAYRNKLNIRTKEAKQFPEVDKEIIDNCYTSEAMKEIYVKKL